MRRRWGALLAVPMLTAACASPHPAAGPAPPAPPVSTAPALVRASDVAAPLPAAAPAASPTPSRALFETSVKPILVSNCMPCHFTGGKMYATLPFDDPAVVAARYAGVLRRIKNAEQKAALESWLSGTRE